MIQAALGLDPGGFFILRADMIELSTLPSWSAIYSRIGEPPPRRKRGRCPIHDGDSFCSVALDDDKGVFYCHVCHAGGDKISFVQQVHRCDFIHALRFFGLEPGRPPAPDPERLHRQRIRAGLQAWAKTTAKELRFEHYIRMRVEVAAKRRLKQDPEDAWGWTWLQWVYTGLDALVYKLDLLEGREVEQIEAYRHMGAAA